MQSGTEEENKQNINREKRPKEGRIHMLHINIYFNRRAASLTQYGNKLLCSKAKKQIIRLLSPCSPTSGVLFHLHVHIQSVLGFPVSSKRPGFCYLSAIR